MRGSGREESADGVRNGACGQGQAVEGERCQAQAERGRAQGSELKPPLPVPLASFHLLPHDDNRWAQSLAIVKCVKQSGRFPRKLVRRVRRRQEMGG